ncbi:hypothetical protein BJY01DRAFT_249375 [Aspergillus pseudoustus]|uniref:F-box domain-containing protein n=1 Tax=Aspergillus pseudoustus TaxID=1810923 RepID=A0ABR4JQ13_9EURO
MDRLPTELVLAIAVHVSNVKDRLNLLRVCRHWRAALFDLVYDALRINTRQISNLVETLLSIPRLATRIRNVTVLEWYGGSSWSTRESLSSNIQTLLNEIAEGPKEINDWNKELLRAEQDSWLALLLVLTPNLISLSWDLTRPSPWVTVVASRVALKNPPFDTRPALQHLQTVRILDIRSDDPSVYTSFYQVMPFFHLPSMQSMSLENVRDFGPFEADLSLLHCDQRAIDSASRTSPIETLTLGSCNLSNAVARFIKSCANLRKLIYQHDNEVDEGIHRDFRPRPFYSALSSQKNSLEVLHLNDCGQGSWGLDDSWEDDDFEPARRWLGSFAEFEKLWDLRVRVQNLLNLHPEDQHHSVFLKDILPNSLKWLHLTDCDEDHCPVLVNGLLNLLSNRQELFPDLEQIIIYSAVAESSQPPPTGPHRPPSDVRVSSTISQQFAAVQTMCNRVGIAFKLLLRDEYIIVYRG